MRSTPHSLAYVYVSGTYHCDVGLDYVARISLAMFLSCSPPPPLIHSVPRSSLHPGVLRPIYCLREVRRVREHPADADGYYVRHYPVITASGRYRYRPGGIKFMLLEVEFTLQRNNTKKVLPIHVVVLLLATAISFSTKVATATDASAW